MYKYRFFTTGDGTVGLYDPNIDDIYHSAAGAATEALTKFVLPACIAHCIGKNTDIKVLDLCYGIGYNSKVFLNYILKNFLKNKNKFFEKHKNALSPYIGKIHSDNVPKMRYSGKIYTDNEFLEDIRNKCSFSIYSDNNLKELNNKNYIMNMHEDGLRNKIFIDAVDNNPELSLISPFIISKQKSIKNKSDFKNSKILKYLKLKNNDLPKEYHQYLCCSKALNLYLLEELIPMYQGYYSAIQNILTDTKYTNYFDPAICRLFKFYFSDKYSRNLGWTLSAFLHNIYYKYLSIRHKNDLKALNMLNIKIKMNFDDARNYLSDNTSKYNIIFLDAFTPSKAPELWTLDFFKLLYKHLDDDGIILTYSSAAPVRNAFINSGFYVGKLYNQFENKYFGTIASKDEKLIENKLSRYEIELLNTKAGIMYRDLDLNLNRAEILKARQDEFNSSELISSSTYKKQFNNKN